jgi:hypothetical protein
MTAESTEDKILKGLVQVFTRGQTNYVALQIRDSTGLPPYEIPIGLAEFIKYLESCDLATLTIRELLDLGTLYFPMIENFYLKELKRRAEFFGSMTTR